MSPITILFIKGKATGQISFFQNNVWWLMFLRQNEQWKRNNYCNISIISRTKPENLNVSCLIMQLSLCSISLRWRHNDHAGVSNHQPHGCLLNRLFRRKSRKHQSSASLAFVREIHRGPVNFPHKWPVTRKMFPFDDVIMIEARCQVEYEDVVGAVSTGDAPTTSEWSTVLLPTKVCI